MFKIELTKGGGWDAPALASKDVTDVRIAGAEKFARLWLQQYRTEHPDSGVDGYRVRGPRGEPVKASNEQT